ncbi:gliding motility-associated peptidyl-prolyl isomerase GldI [Poritiphilus flavus]|uniref:Peptidyl-prolyl cis-trans isomerase n=1 Tax=Poritiphilus flavus TaxID=2697053 RepID=A0A6L9E9E7_9FLAO|nr:gliding motility-associated peptidyl-prolyl isomerase GldI [Poritiphilus flavus]NAS11385.1 gliding motility-associated peptidyl-prolyl isomerase GldI [Poritiphilus flavus]
MKTLSYFILFAFLLSCAGPEPRKPIKVQSGSFYKESVERNKKLLAEEEQLIREIITRDSLHQYISSASGSWYYYDNKVEGEGILPEPDDLVTLSYDIRNLQNDTIYKADEIGVITYKVDKQELFPGLRNAVKLLKENEVATFLVPSSLGYGYHGDDKRIGINVPLKTTISILKIEKQQKKDKTVN